jgi:photosystem II stability/assembly factor-like uncharacterized protein
MALPIRVLFSTAACLILANQSLLAHDPHDPMYNVALSPNFAQDQTIFMATNQLSIKMGVYALMKSTDGGVTWYVVQGMPSTAPIVVIAFSPGYATDQTIFTAGNGGLSESTNQGSSWTLLSADALTDVALSPNFATDNTLFIVTTKKTIFKSKNRGQSWAPISPPTTLTSSLSMIAVSPNFANDHTLLLGTDANGIYKSTNGGTSWVQVTSDPTLPQVTSLTFSPDFSTDRTAFATTLGAGFLISTNGGALWKLSNSGISDMKATALALSPTYSTDKTLWVTTAVAGVFQSTNVGASWSGTTVSRTLSPLTNTHYQTIAATAEAVMFCIWECMKDYGLRAPAPYPGSISISSPPGLCATSTCPPTTQRIRRYLRTLTAAPICGPPPLEQAGPSRTSACNSPIRMLPAFLPITRSIRRLFPVVPTVCRRPPTGERSGSCSRSWERTFIPELWACLLTTRMTVRSWSARQSPVIRGCSSRLTVAVPG